MLHTCAVQVVRVLHTCDTFIFDAHATDSRDTLSAHDNGNVLESAPPDGVACAVCIMTGQRLAQEVRVGQCSCDPTSAAPIRQARPRVPNHSSGREHQALCRMVMQRHQFTTARNLLHAHARAHFRHAAACTTCHPVCGSPDANGDRSDPRRGGAGTQRPEAHRCSEIITVHLLVPQWPARPLLRAQSCHRCHSTTTSLRTMMTMTMTMTMTWLTTTAPAHVCAHCGDACCGTCGGTDSQ